MGVIFLLIGFSVLVALIFLAAFIWSTKTGQFEDDYTPSVRMLFDNDTQQAKQTVKQTEKQNN